MTRSEGMKLMGNTLENLERCQRRLEELNEAVTHPVAAEVQSKADDVIRLALGVALLALNLKEMPAAAKKPFASFLYTLADSISMDEDEF